MGNDEEILNQIVTDRLRAEQDLIKVAEEAEKVAEILKKKYRFEEGVERIKVYNDGYTEEYVTRDSDSDLVWHANYMQTQYEQKISKEEIYNLYRDYYLFENKYLTSDFYRKQARKAGNFMEFVKHTRLMR